MSQIRLLTRSRVSPVQTSRSFSHLHRKDGITGQILSQQQSNMYMGQRHFIGIVTRNLPRILKLRYLLFGGAVAGGTAASKKYDQWKDSLPDTSWIRDMFPDTGQISDKANTYWTEFRRSATQMKSKLSLPDKSWIPVELKNKLHNGRESVSRILEEGFNQHSKSLLLQGQGQSSIKSWQVKVRGEDDENANNSNSAESKMQTETMFMSASANSSSSSKDTADVQEELLNIQTKYQHEIDRLEKENRELRKQALLRRDSKPNTERKSSRSMRRSPIDMYSDILDSLSTYDTSYNAQDHLPRVVVVGDQSSGKTSVLEMIAQARIFPRGHGEMMTRSPVMVTLSEGPFHVAQLKGSEREYDLSNEGDLSALRKEIESRMRRSVQGGKTISSEVISLSVKGPGLHRMVLVDLPGIISTVTTGMSSDTKSSIQGLCRKYMENPNAIILCIQDGSIDAERSNVTDLVSSIDKEGKRTIFVLTKVDMAESGLHNPDRIKAILDGQLFPMKALGYFAVVTGSGNNADSISSIRQHEEEFFKKSKLARDGILKPGQMTTRNMSMAVSQRFWKMVHDSVEQQADEFKATRYNLETEWKNTYPGLRELDRGEVFEKARSEILDQLITLSQVQSEEWEQILSNSMWEKMAPTLFESIYLPACASKDAGSFHTSVDIKLKNWIDKSLPSMAVDVGRSTLKDRFSKLLADNLADNQVDTSITGAFKMAVLEEVFIRHKWDDKAADSLRVLQQICLEDRSIHSKSQWEEAVDFMVKNLEQEKVKTEKNIRDILGPGTMEQWTSWTSRSTVQHLTDNIRKELEPLLIGSAKQPRPAHLTHDEIQTVRSNVIRNNGNKPTQISDEAIKDTWYHVYRSHFLNNTITRAKMCRKAFNFYSHGQSPADCGLDCKDVQLFWRVKTMLKTSSSTLRQQIRDHEARRLERIMKEVLDEFSDNPEKLHRLISGDRVKLAEDLKKVRHIQDKLEEFIKCLNREKQ